MKKINILYIIWSLGLGGAERCVINLAKGLDKQKFNVFACCLNDEGAFADEVKKYGIQVITLDKKPNIDLSIIPKIMKIIKQNNIDIVHTHLWTSNFWGRIAAVLSRAKVIIAQEHGISENRTALRFGADRFLSLFTDKIVFVSRNIKQNFIKNVSYDENKAVVIHNGIDLQKFNLQPDKLKDKKDLGIENGNFVLSCIGRLSKEKGHADLFDALSKLKDSNVKLLIVGDGALSESLKSEANALGIQKNVIFTGLRKDIPQILSCSDLVVIPSLREAHSVVALESMASGVPVVATDVGGTNEIVDNARTGFLVPAKDPDALAQKISVLIKDDKLRVQMSENCRKRAKELFSISRMIAQTQQLYKEVLNKKCQKRQ